MTTEEELRKAKEEGFRLGVRVGWGACLDWCSAWWAGNLLRLLDTAGQVPLPRLENAEKINQSLSIDELKRRVRLVFGDEGGTG